jgi:hypothetical protein
MVSCVPLFLSSSPDIPVPGLPGEALIIFEVPGGRAPGG